MSCNKNLTHAKRAKNDEFYTRLSDVSEELDRYVGEDGVSLFKGKTVYCNCDNCFVSNFFLYFALNFYKLGLKKLIATCYAPTHEAYSRFVFFEGIPPATMVRTAYKIELEGVEDHNGNGEIDKEDIEWLLNETDAVKVLDGDGDFRSPECLELLDECDIVATNPPFSLFREFVSLLVSRGKDFTIIGNMNAFSYKDIFAYMLEGKCLPGYSFHKPMLFEVPDDYDGPSSIVDGKRMSVGPTVAWFTSMPIVRDNPPIDLQAHYYGNEDKYPMYDNYEAINVDSISEIPQDYEGIMGVPITFLGKHTPDQFEVVDLFGKPTVNGKEIFTRIAIHNKKFPLKKIEKRMPDLLTRNSLYAIIGE